MPSEMCHLAGQDLRAAELMLAEPDDFAPRIAAYHVQQCIEKCIKQALRLYGVNYTKTHRILDLIDMLPDGQRVFSAEVLERLEISGNRIADWEAKTRYASGYLVKRSTVQQGIDLARLVLSELKAFECTLPQRDENTGIDLMVLE